MKKEGIPYLKYHPGRGRPSGSYGEVVKVLVIRFPNGSWSYGGKPHEYGACLDGFEFYWVETVEGRYKKAIRKAQRWRSRNK